MQYTLTVVYTTYNTGSVTEEFKFDRFRDMRDYVIDNCSEWESYSIATEWEV